MQWLRCVLVWLLVLAMPVQGAAAAVMASCGPTGAHPPAVRILDVRSAVASDGVAAQASMPAEHDHHDHLAQPPQPDATSAHAMADGDEQTSDHSAHGTQKKCSACASCCSMTALPSLVSALPVPELAPTVFFCIVPRVVACAAEGPERPPRSLLA